MKRLEILLEVERNLTQSGCEIDVDGNEGGKIKLIMVAVSRLIGCRSCFC